MRHDTRLQRAVLDTLESRQLLSTYYVSTEGDDANDGSAAHPWRTLQQAADSVIAGDVVNVGPGTYKGFSLGVNRPARGTSDAPIVFNGKTIIDKGSYHIAAITVANGDSPDGIYVAPGSRHIVIKNFNVQNPKGVMRAGIRVKHADNISLLKNDISGTGDFGISAVRSDDLTLAGNGIRYGWTRGISVVGGRDAVIQRNSVSTTSGKPRFRFGIDLQADTGADEFVSNALVRGNGIDRGGIGINAAGVRNSRFVNNVLIENRGDGLVLTTAPGVGDSRDNVVANNSIDHYAIEGWALNISGHTTGTVVLNNILLNRRDTGGSILISLDSREGLLVDHNIYDNRFSTNGGDSTISLKAWRNRLGQDAHSFVATPEELFLRVYAHSIHGRSPAVNMGTLSHAPKTDRWGRARIGAPDIGAVEAGYADSFHYYGTSADGEFAGTSGPESGDEWYFPLRLSPTYFESFNGQEATLDSPLGPDWELLPWHSDEDGVPSTPDLTGMLMLSGALIRSTTTVTGAVETRLFIDGASETVTSAATHVFGIGDAFGPLGGNHWAAFVTKGSENTLYAQINIGGTLQQVNLGPEEHFGGIFRIEPTAVGFRFYRNNELVASLAGVFPDAVEPKILIGSHHEARMLYAEYVEAGPYTSGGTYTSVVHDERVTGAWGQLVIPDAPQLHNTALLFETRTGHTTNPDGSWSAWESLGADDMIQSPEGRFIQVRVTFVTTNPQRSPLFFGYQIDARPAA